MIKDFLLNDEELIIEFTKIKTEEFNTALAFLNAEYEENRLNMIHEQSQQTSVYHFPSLVDSICKNIKMLTQSDRGSLMFYVEQRKQLQYLSLELARRIEKLESDHSSEITTFNNLFS